MTESRSYVCVDIETTGLALTETAMIELAAVKIENGQVVGEYESLIHSKKRIPDYVVGLTGIKAAMLKTAPEFSKVAEDFCAFLGDAVLVAHNADFDVDVINLHLAGIQRPPLLNLVLDTQDLATILYPTTGSHKLSELAMVLTNESSEQIHRALPDAHNVAKVLQVCLAQMDQLPPIVIRESLRILPPKKQALRQVLESKATTTMTDHYLSQLHQNPLQCIGRQSTATQNVAGYFGNESPFKTALTQFETRPTQQEMAMAIEAVFDSNTHLAVEAPTGTGKSLAYTIPAILHAKKTEQSVIISTRTKHLQTQLEKVLPKLDNIGLPQFHYIILKGKENYVDIAKFDLMYREYCLGKLTGHEVLFLGLFHWILTTKTGDLSELHGSILGHFEYKVSFQGFRQGLSNRLRSHCFVHQMRKYLKSADLIITNHSVVMTDLENDMPTLPEYSAIIFDEAHTLEDATIQALGKRVTPRFFFDLATLLDDGNGNGLIRSLEDPGKLPELYRQLVHHGEGFAQLMSVPKPPVDTQILKSAGQVTEMFVRTKEVLSDLQKTILELDECLLNLSKKVAEEDTQKDEVLEVLFASQKRLETTTYFLKNTDDDVVWIEWASKRQNGTLSMAPMSCHKQLARHFFNTPKSVICTSASLSVNGNFDFFLHRIGLFGASVPHKTLRLPCEFDLKNQALFAQADPPDLAEFLLNLFTAVQGRTLVLFTSFRHLQDTHAAISQHPNAPRFQILCQRLHGTRESILERFKRGSKHKVIFGLESFWEGVDIPGDTLSCVVVHRLPFAPPSDPLVSARLQKLETAGRNGFMDYTLPMAVLKFKQGIGRLIRTKSDRGCVVTLDPRLGTKAYGKVFLNEVKEYRSVSGNPQEVCGQVGAFLTDK